MQLNFHRVTTSSSIQHIKRFPNLITKKNDFTTSYRPAASNKKSSLHVQNNSQADTTISRFSGNDNLAASWQSKGGHYVSYENLKNLNSRIIKYDLNRSKYDKENLLNDLALTYFARFHNLIREEYQHEKSLIEARIKTWSKQKLEREGYSLFNMVPAPKGNLFQDKIFRFSYKEVGSLMPFHRFTVGDTVRITLGKTGNPLDTKDGIDGVVLERRQRYIDICVPYSNGPFIQRSNEYRLDAFVNRVSYERMLNSLQIFLTGASTTGPGTLPLSQTLHDLILYSYPNSMLNLARSPGGLRMALPIINTNINNIPPSAKPNNIYTKNITPLKPTGPMDSLDNYLTRNSNSYSTHDVIHAGNNNNNNNSAVLSEETLIANQVMKSLLDQKVDFKMSVRPIFTQGHVIDINRLLSEDDSEGDGSAPRLITVSEAMKRNRRTIRVGDSRPEPDEQSPQLMLPPVFVTNHRLRELSESFPAAAAVSSRSSDEATAIPTYVHSKKDIERALEIILKKNKTDLNPSQMSALTKSITRPLSLIQGPPGCGKTYTACILLATLATLREERLKVGGIQAKGQKLSKILACAHSNIATDNILDGLIKLGLNVLRIGRPANINSNLWNYTLDSKLQSNIEWQEAKADLDLDADCYSYAKTGKAGRGDDGSDYNLAQLKSKMEDSKKKLEDIEKRVISTILLQADCIVSTCIGSASETIRSLVNAQGVRFETVLIDEAAQCMEVAVLPTLGYGCERLILIGDQNQLPPVVVSNVAMDQGLGVSMFSRLYAAGMTPFLLTEQYRMHPSIASFSSERFYDGKVKSKVTVLDRPTPKGIPFPNRNVPVMFLDISHSTASTCTDSTGKLTGNSSVGFESRSNSTQTSYHNAREIESVVEIIADIIAAAEVCLDDIGVISPYNAQVQKMLETFREKGWVEPLRSSQLENNKNNKIKIENKFENNSMDISNEYLNNIFSDTPSLSLSLDVEVEVDMEEKYLEVRSVDGFQGREKEVIIISTVRSNSRGNVGFLKDWRRLNVAITRARSGLVVVGDSQTLYCDEHWSSFIDWCKSKGCYKSPTNISNGNNNANASVDIINDNLGE